jgi:hypothetical protein
MCSIPFADVEEAIDFFRQTYFRAADRGQYAPKLTLNTSTVEGQTQGTILFDQTDRTQLEALWPALSF